MADHDGGWGHDFEDSARGSIPAVVSRRRRHTWIPLAVYAIMVAAAVVGSLLASWLERTYGPEIVLKILFWASLCLLAATLVFGLLAIRSAARDVKRKVTDRGEGR